MALVPVGLPRNQYFNHPIPGGNFGNTRGWNWNTALWPDFSHKPFSTDWFEQRCLEMERRFSDFMQKIDQRFNGMLSVVGLETEPNFPIPVFHDSLNGVKETKNHRQYTIEINVQDFKPEEVRVKICNGKAQVHAKRETKNEDNDCYAYTCREFQRTFTLPDGMRTEDVSSSLSNDGILEIKGIRTTPLEITSIPIDVVHVVDE